MLELSLTSAGIGSLAGIALSGSRDLYSEPGKELVVYQEPPSAFDGMRSVVLTPIVKEVLRYGLETAAMGLLAHTGCSPSQITSASLVSLLFGMHHFCTHQASVPASLHTALKGFCFSYLRHYLGIPSALIAHSVHNLIEYREEGRLWDQMVFQSEREYDDLKYAMMKFNDERSPKKQVVGRLPALPPATEARTNDAVLGRELVVAPVERKARKDKKSSEKKENQPPVAKPAARATPPPQPYAPAPDFEIPKPGSFPLLLEY